MSEEIPPGNRESVSAPMGSAPFLGGVLEWIAQRSGLAIAPAIGYFLCFTYESSYCGVFGIPSSLIQSSLTQVLVFVSVAIAGGQLFVVLLESLSWSQKVDENNNPISRVLSMYLAPSVLLLALLEYSDLNHLFRFWLITGSIVAFCLLDFARAAADNSVPKKALIYRLKGPFHHYSTKNALPSATVRLFGKNSAYILVMYLAWVYATALGEGTAYKQTRFLVPERHPDSIIVRIYDSNAICAEFDPETKKLTKRYWVSSTDVKDFGAFEMKVIGPLNF
jgi:hypothetical protein